MGKKKRTISEKIRAQQVAGEVHCTNVYLAAEKVAKAWVAAKVAGVTIQKSPHPEDDAEESSECAAALGHALEALQALEPYSEIITCSVGNDEET